MSRKCEMIKKLFQKNYSTVNYTIPYDGKKDRFFKRVSIKSKM